MSHAVQAALAVAGAPDESNPANALIVAKVRALLQAYARVWSDSEYTIEAVERTVTAPLYHPSTKRVSRIFRNAGKLDVCASDGENRRLVMDHKSTGDEIDSPDATYWRQQIIESQWLHYMMLEWSNGRKVDYVLLNVVRKPSISPREFKSKKELSELLLSRRYFGREISDESMRFARTNERENLELYESRLTYDASVIRPRWYFQRKPLWRPFATDLGPYMEELWQDALEIRAERLRPHHTKNSRACMHWGVPCQFLNICAGHDEWDSDRWQRKKNVHEELPVFDLVEGDSRDYLTNSRIAMYKLCHRKHDYLYNLGIERQEASEALAFGNLWHKVLAELYLEKQFEQNGDEGRTINEQSEPATQTGSGDAGTEGWL